MKAYLKPCPCCGGKLLAKGKGFSICTPRLLRWLNSLHGVTCVRCGCYRPSVRAWNKEERHE